MKIAQCGLSLALAVVAGCSGARPDSSVVLSSITTPAISAEKQGTCTAVNRVDGPGRAKIARLTHDYELVPMIMVADESGTSRVEFTLQPRTGVSPTPMSPMPLMADAGDVPVADASAPPAADAGAVPVADASAPPAADAGAAPPKATLSCGATCPAGCFAMGCKPVQFKGNWTCGTLTCRGNGACDGAGSCTETWTLVDPVPLPMMNQFGL